MSFLSIFVFKNTTKSTIVSNVRYARYLRKEFLGEYLPKVDNKHLEEHKINKFTKYSSIDPPTVKIEEKNEGGANNNNNNNNNNKSRNRDGVAQMYPQLYNSLPYFMKDGMRETVERREMMKRHKHIDIPIFYTGSIMAATVSDSFSHTKMNRFVGICIYKNDRGLLSSFRLRNVIDNIETLLLECSYLGIQCPIDKINSNKIIWENSVGQKVLKKEMVWRRAFKRNIIEFRNLVVEVIKSINSNKIKMKKDQRKLRKLKEKPLFWFKIVSNQKYLQKYSNNSFEQEIEIHRRRIKRIVEQSKAYHNKINEDKELQKKGELQIFTKIYEYTKAIIKFQFLYNQVSIKRKEYQKKLETCNSSTFSLYKFKELCNKELKRIEYFFSLKEVLLMSLISWGHRVNFNYHELINPERSFLGEECVVCGNTSAKDTRACFTKCCHYICLCCVEKGFIVNGFCPIDMKENDELVLSNGSRSSTFDYLVKNLINIVLKHLLNYDIKYITEILTGPLKTLEMYNLTCKAVTENNEEVVMDFIERMSEENVFKHDSQNDWSHSIHFSFFLYIFSIKLKNYGFETEVVEKLRLEGLEIRNFLNYLKIKSMEIIEASEEWILDLKMGDNFTNKSKRNYDHFNEFHTKKEKLLMSLEYSKNFMLNIIHL